MYKSLSFFSKKGTRNQNLYDYEKDEREIKLMQN